MQTILPKVQPLELQIDPATDQSGALNALALKLNCGLTYQILSHSISTKKSLLRRIISLPNAALVTPDGGLISNLTAQENILLPIQYHSVTSNEAALKNAIFILRLFNLSDDEISRLFRSTPVLLSSFEKKLIGFARVMIIEPEILVCDNIFEGLTSNEIAIIARFGEIFHLHFPFRTVIYLELDHARGIIRTDKIIDLP